MKLSIADENWSISEAAAVCRWYADVHPATLTYYDFGGTDTDPHAHDTVELSDAGRLVVFNARLDANDVPNMIKAARQAPWQDVTHSDDLLAEGWKELLDRADRLYQHFRTFPGGRLGPTRTHKLLHLKRPRVFPIIDSVVRETYKQPARQEAHERGVSGALYWPVLAKEIRGNAQQYQELRDALRNERIGRLTVPRLHDILVWSLHGRQSHAARAVAQKESRTGEKRP